MLVQDFLTTSAQRDPHKIGLVCGTQRLTYADLDQRSNRLARAMQARGLGRGDRVVIHLGNSVESVLAVFGALKAGAVFVVVNPSVKEQKLRYIVDDCDGAALFTSAQNARLANEIVASMKSIRFVVLSGETPPNHKATGSMVSFETILGEASSAKTPTSGNIDKDLACLIYTSGSTGDPKGVVCGHDNVAFVSGSVIDYLENTSDDIVLNVLPFSFDYGLYQLLMAFRFGGTLVLESGFTYPGQVLEAIERERVTGFPGVPTIFSVMLSMDLSQSDLSSLRYITNTAAALPTSHIEELRERFPGVAIYSMYGMTESQRGLYLPPEQIGVRPASVGIPIPGTEAWVEDAQGKRVPPGVVGELVIRGSHVMRGYWHDPDATAGRFRPGPTPGERVLHSGDLFRTDDEGYFYFVGRQDDIIKSRGEKVAPREVENALYGISGVTKAAVIGVPDPVLGEAITAFLVAPGLNLSSGEVIAHCRRNLEDYMVPQYVEFCDTLPETTSGKIAKTSLRGRGPEDSRD